MDEQEDFSKKNIKFPKAVILIILFQYSIKFSYNTLRGALPLYLVDMLNYKADEATVYYHIFNLFLYTFAIAGGIISDSYLGNFKSIVFFSTIFTIGLILLSVSAVPPIHLPIREFTILGLLVAAFGYGAIRPCTVAFGGNQFTLPRQEKQLSLLFVLLCIAENLGSLTMSIAMPVLRKDLTCFGQLTCYSLVFVVPAVTLILTTVVLFLTKRFYIIHKPEGNIVVKVTKCIFYAIRQKFRANKKHQHWLDHANDKYELQLIEDIKSVSSIVKLFLPLLIFWSLYSAQSSLWLFQSSRMNGEIGEYLIKPDQIQLVNPLSGLILMPLFQYIYVFLAKFFAINTHLRRITVGCFIAALAYYVSGIVELNLEPTYAKTPTKGLAQLRIYNTLDCNVSMKIDEQNFIINELDLWQNINIVTSGKRALKYEVDFSNCKLSNIFPYKMTGKLEVIENQATSWGITKNGLNYKFIDHIDKSNSGNPSVRTLIYVEDDITENNLVLNIVNNEQTLKKIALPKNFMESKLEEVAHKTYNLYLNDRLLESNVPLKLGGVYTIMGYVSNLKVAVRTVTVTQPNSLHILWVLPQQILLSIAEIMVYFLVMEFAYSQAPMSMKVILQSFWLSLAFFGNLIIIVITEAHIFERKVFVLFFYATLMTMSGIIFAIVAKFYRYRKPSDDRSENIVDRKNQN